MPDIFGSITNGVPEIGILLICTACSLIFGFAVAGVYMYKNKHSKTLAVTLVLLPSIVQIIIILVNNNIGTGVAVAGAFSLIRFRSVPGNARDIGCLFLAMALGFVSGLGYIFYGFIFLLLSGSVFLLMTRFRFGQGETDIRILRIIIPESLDYDGLFDNIFEKYTTSAELDRVKTSNMGSMYELTYSIHLKADSMPKAFIDELRIRNGNLNILLSREHRAGEEL